MEKLKHGEAKYLSTEANKWQKLFEAGLPEFQVFMWLPTSWNGSDTIGNCTCGIRKIYAPIKFAEW